MDWGLYIGLTGVKAKFRTAQTRLLQHSEAIAALQGAETEKAILSKLFDQVCRSPASTHMAYSRLTLRCGVGCRWWA